MQPSPRRNCDGSLAPSLPEIKTKSRKTCNPNLGNKGFDMKLGQIQECPISLATQNSDKDYIPNSHSKKKENTHQLFILSLLIGDHTTDIRRHRAQLGGHFNMNRPAY